MQQKPPIKYLLCTYQFQSNIELDSKTIMSIFQYYIGQPYWGHEAIKQVMYLQTPHLRVFSFQFLPSFPRFQKFQPPHRIKTHSNSQVVTCTQVYHSDSTHSLGKFGQVLTFVILFTFPKLTLTKAHAPLDNLFSFNHSYLLIIPYTNKNSTS